jgi:hypothetical protein
LQTTYKVRQAKIDENILPPMFIVEISPLQHPKYAGFIESFRNKPNGTGTQPECRGN